MITDYKFNGHLLKLDPILGKGLSVVDANNTEIKGFPHDATVNVERDDATGKIRIVVRGH